MATDNPIPWTPSGKVIDEMWAGDGESDPVSDDVPDMLATMFSAQRATMDRLWSKEIKNGSVPVHPSQFGELDERNVQGRLHEGYGYLVRELSEAMGLLKNKPWKDRMTPVDVGEFREEVADAFHFFIEFCIIAGMDSEELFRQYFAKNAIVINRSETGY